jgi:hypothetical protein
MADVKVYGIELADLVGLSPWPTYFLSFEEREKFERRRRQMFKGRKLRKFEATFREGEDDEALEWLRKHGSVTLTHKGEVWP